MLHFILLAQLLKQWNLSAAFTSNHLLFFVNNQQFLKLSYLLWSLFPTDYYRITVRFRTSNYALFTLANWDTRFSLRDWNQLILVSVSKIKVILWLAFQQRIRSHLKTPPYLPLYLFVFLQRHLGSRPWSVVFRWFVHSAVQLTILCNLKWGLTLRRTGLVRIKLLKFDSTFYLKTRSLVKCLYTHCAAVESVLVIPNGLFKQISVILNTLVPRVVYFQV
jgi:hypothetical protein